MMTKRFSLFVVAATVAALVLSGCGRGPGTDDMADDMPADMPMMPSFDGTWHFEDFVAMIEGTAVTVTVGTGMAPVVADPTSPYAAVTQVVAKGTLSAGEMGYMLTLDEGDDAISVTLMPGATQVNPAAESLAKAAIRAVIEGAQSGTVMITVADDTMTVTGSFLTDLATALGGTVPATGLVGCKDAPCMMAS